MAKITRFNGNVKAIASESQAGERYVFGSTTLTSDELTAQMTNDLLRGWATVGPSDFPPLEWFNAVAFTATQFNSYLHQMGVAEWDALQEYPTDGALVIHNGAQWSRTTGWVVGDEPGVSSTWVEVGASSYDFSASGYYVFSGGLIIQWGSTTISSGDGSINPTLPIAFPNAILSAMANTQKDNAAAAVTSLTTTSITASSLDIPTGVNTIDGKVINWLAIGY